MSGTPQLANKVAIVTGGSRGIGFGIASALISHGVNVMISSRTDQALLTARSKIEALTSSDSARFIQTGSFEFLRTDVRNQVEVQRLFDVTVERFGGLDILINNAAVGPRSDVFAQSPEEWREIIDTNLSGVFYCCRAAIPLLRRRLGGWIINVSSLAGTHPFAGAAAYCASKAGLNAFSEALMQELRHDDIRVSCVAPGSVDTIFAGSKSDASTEWKLSVDDVAKVVTDLLSHSGRSLPSRVEIRPAKPRR